MFTHAPTWGSASKEKPFFFFFFFCCSVNAAAAAVEPELEEVGVWRLEDFLVDQSVCVCVCVCVCERERDGMNVM